MYYTLGAVKYCFPFDTTQYINVSDPTPEEIELLGVFAPYVGQKMTEKEADDFLCKVISRHPFMKNAMDVEVQVMWNDGDCCFGYYHIITINNPNDGKENKKYKPSPIRWR